VIIHAGDGLSSRRIGAYMKPGAGQHVGQFFRFNKLPDYIKPLPVSHLYGLILLGFKKCIFHQSLIDLGQKMARSSSKKDRLDRIIRQDAEQVIR
jgi:hypothetical protein